jgi:hypothetical protein
MPSNGLPRLIENYNPKGKNKTRKATEETSRCETRMGQQEVQLLEKFLLMMMMIDSLLYQYLQIRM